MDTHRASQVTRQRFSKQGKNTIPFPREPPKLYKAKIGEDTIVGDPIGIPVIPSSFDQQDLRGL